VATADGRGAAAARAAAEFAWARVVGGPDVDRSALRRFSRDLSECLLLDAAADRAATTFDDPRSILRPAEVATALALWPTVVEIATVAAAKTAGTSMISASASSSSLASTTSGSSAAPVASPAAAPAGAMPALVRLGPGSSPVAPFGSAQGSPSSMSPSMPTASAPGMSPRRRKLDDI
jgi:hypothetical protein